MPEFVVDPTFWVGLGKIMLVNIILSGDNAVVIALAARSLPDIQRRQAVIWGSAAAITMRIILTFTAGELLEMPYLKLIGSILLLWIGIKLLAPEDGEGEASVCNHTSLSAAIRTILLADLVMSLDNVLAVAGAANGDKLLLGIGLVFSIPLVIFGSTVVMKLMDRFPSIIILGAGILGYVAGEMLGEEPAFTGYEFQSEIHVYAPLIGAVLVIALGKGLAMGKEKGRRHELVDLVPDSQQHHSPRKKS